MEHLIGMPAIEVSEIQKSQWDEILGMQNAKKAIEKHIALPLANPEIARKHGITIPKVILLF
jgi:ATP-dependent 26S proteasome regulatory subunit